LDDPRVKIIVVITAESYDEPVVETIFTGQQTADESCFDHLLVGYDPAVETVVGMQAEKKTN